MKKALAIALIALLTANLILYGLGKISAVVFWVIIAIGALGSYLLKKIH
jgi:hypothetical protein